MSKKKKTLDELLENLLVPQDEHPYEVPENWEWLRLEIVSDYIQRGKSPKYVENSNAIVVSQKCVQWSGFDISVARNIDEASLEKYTEERFLKKQDLLWNSTGTGTIGRVAIIEDELKTPTVADSHVTVIRANPKLVFPKYLYYWLRSSFIQNKLENSYNGSTNQIELNLSAVKKEVIILPPLKEQKKIANKIEILFTKLDEAKQLIKEAKETFKLRRAAILDEAFNGELTFNAENEIWNTSKLGDLIVEGPQNGLYKPQTAYGEGNLIVRIDNFYDGYINSWDSLKRLDLNPKELQTYRIVDGDILINRVNSIQYLGKSALVRNLKEPCVFESNIMRLRVNKEIIDNEYLILYLNSNRGLQELRKNAKHAVNQASINQTDVKNVLIPLPSIKEQKEIVEIVEKLLEKESTVLRLINEEYSRLSLLKQSILSKAFKGELGTNDSTDESALDLLKSILKEKL